MDEISQPRRPAAGAGGTIEPEPRREQSAVRDITVPTERYELRDPFSEVTYRARSEEEIVRKADQLGSLRYIAIDSAGRRAVVEKVKGEWQRGRSSAATPAPDAKEQDREKPPRTQKSPKVVDPTTSVDGAEETRRRSRLEAALVERYLIKRASIGDVGRTEYRFRGDVSRIAFTESMFRLATDTNSPSVARSMVDVAEARQWTALRVSGHEDFRRMVWLEASARGVKAAGYEPNPADVELLRKAREDRLVNRIEPTSNSDLPNATKSSGRGDGGRKAVLAAIEAVLVAKGVPEPKRQAVMAAAAEKLAQRIRDGQKFQVKVYDRAAPSQRPVTRPAPEPQRAKERPAPVR